VAEELKIYSIAEAAKLLGPNRTEEWLRTLIRRGDGPVARRISPNRIVILQSDLHKWIDSLEFVGRPRLRGETDTEITIDTGELNEQNAK
jgi:hypothetical protein